MDTCYACISNLVRPLNTLIFLKSDVKSRSAGAGFEPAAYGFEVMTSDFPYFSRFWKVFLTQILTQHYWITMCIGMRNEMFLFSSLIVPS